MSSRAGNKTYIPSSSCCFAFNGYSWRIKEGYIIFLRAHSTCQASWHFKDLLFFKWVPSIWENVLLSWGERSRNLHQKSLDSAASLLDVGPGIVWMSVQTKNSGSDRLCDVFTLPPAFRDQHISKWLFKMLLCVHLARGLCHRWCSPQTASVLKAGQLRILFNGGIYIPLQNKHW